MNSHSEVHSTSQGIALLEFKEFRSLLRSVHATHLAGVCGSKNEWASNVNKYNPVEAVTLTRSAETTRRNGWAAWHRPEPDSLGPFILPWTDANYPLPFSWLHPLILPSSFLSSLLLTWPCLPRLLDAQQVPPLLPRWTHYPPLCPLLPFLISFEKYLIVINVYIKQYKRKSLPWAQ